MQNNIKIYNQNPENINQKLNENMVFELADNEAKEVKKIISFEKIHNLRKKLQKWNANYLTSFSKIELTNPQEFIPLLSIYYQRPARFNPESGLILLQKVLKDKNRFLVWFSVRYYADIRQF
ncbi:DNA-directed RNA polymerase subunit beta', partial [Campylobacter jejuni]|nr:DNA-directed RNA polymerase subunit beta' [Campylobacter jejuni]